MADRKTTNPLWQSVVLRLLVIWLLGWATILWFQGCLVPATRDEMRDDLRKHAAPQPPAR